MAADGRKEHEGRWTLWYGEAAEKFVEALPIGNGRLGGMVYGGVRLERVQLNEDTLWSGYPYDTNNYGAYVHLEEARWLAFEGKFAEAQRLVESKMLGPFTQSYMPLGDVTLELEHPDEEVRDYRRELDLERGAARVQYRCGDVGYLRDFICSAPDQVMALRITADHPGSVSFTIRADSPLKHKTLTKDGLLVLTGQCPSNVDPNYFNVEGRDPVVYEDGKGMMFTASIKLECEGGTTEAVDDRTAIRVQGADAVTILIAAATSYVDSGKDPFANGRDPEEACLNALRSAEKLEWKELCRRHVEDYRPLYERVRLDLGSGLNDRLPTDVRLMSVKAGESDPALEALLFQYGRYLMISGSRLGTQALNLQGIWNDQVRAPWSSNYTVNINAQMNYWPAETCHLPECHEPMLDLIEELSATGAKTAKIHYGCEGWTVHHNTDLWRLTSPVGRTGELPDTAVWAMWPMGGAWLVRHLWDRFEFGGDVGYLRERAYPLMKGSALFLLDWLIENERGERVTNPSTSPENRFLTSEGEEIGVAVASTMDLALIRDVFGKCREASRILGDVPPEDEALLRRIDEALAKLPAYRIGSYGELQEWFADFEEAEPGHRHVSHLYPLYPGNEITPRSTPDLAEACRRSLERRMVNGGGHTGWSCVWLINLWARLEDGEQAYRFVHTTLAKSSYPNLFGAHPPFQIDGNFGYTAGVAEMLVQSHAGEVSLLPALPRAWATGTVRGLKARGGHEVGIRWEAGKLKHASLRAGRSGECAVRTRTGMKTITDRGKAVIVKVLDSSAGGYVYRFNAIEGETYHFMEQE